LGGFYLRSRVIQLKRVLVVCPTSSYVVTQVPNKQAKRSPAPIRQAPKRSGPTAAQYSQFRETEKLIKKLQKKKKVHKQKGLLSVIGQTVGNAVSPGSGGIVGAAAGDILGNLFGWGDYHTAPVGYPVNSNSVMGFQTPMAAQIPMMHTEDGICRIRKREYIGDIFMYSTWQTSTYYLNPASETTFPWLSQIARNYEQFKFLGLAFGFRSLTANALASVGDPSMGSVTMLTQYDLYDAIVTSKTQANNMMFATSCKPAENMLHPVECDPEQTPSQPLYTGVNELPSTIPQPFGETRDYRLTYMGATTIGVQGGPEEAKGYTAGELWVTYDIMLYKPATYTGLSPPTMSLAEQRIKSEKSNKARTDLRHPPPPITVPTSPSGRDYSRCREPLTGRSDFTMVDR
jgi:hypothetical protein